MSQALAKLTALCGHTNLSQIKPDGQTAVAGLLHKVLLVPTHSQACLFSKKLQLGWLRLQFMAGVPYGSALFLCNLQA